MALRDYFRRADKTDKGSALSVPPGAKVTPFTQDELSTLAQQAYSTGVFEPLNRNPWLAGVPFGPNNPLLPAAINPIGEDGRPDPRRWEYPVAWNIQVTDNRLVPWPVLRTAADQIDILRRCIEVLKAKVTGMDWDITFSESASEMVQAEFGGNDVRAMQQAREKYQDQISRARNFMQVPDRINGLSFKDWLNMALEEVLVLDALAIYPHPDLKGDLHSLTILDGSTIKPLLDDRGMRPDPLTNTPAFQQILYGFPRGEFLATSDDPSQDGAYNADELIYLKRNHRTWTPYGFSPTERALPLADLYIKRQQWLRAEFTDGVTPEMWLKPDGSFAATPELLRAYENIINDDLAGMTEQRKRARILPPGLDPIDNNGFSEKFNDTFDNYCITGITGHYGVLPTEIGYSAKGGLGGSGHQSGEADSASRIGVEPLVLWLEQQLSDICYKFLGMPRELVFKFNVNNEDDSKGAAERRQIELNSGQRTINQAKADMGLPLIDSPYADFPMIQSGANTFFMTPDGVVAFGTSTATPPEQEPAGITPEEATDGETPAPDEATKSADIKVGQMVSWNASGGRATGKVTKVVRDGKINVPNSSFSITGTEEDPAALIRVYQNDKPTDTLVGHKASTLRVVGTKADTAEQEVKAFLKWVKKGNTERDFEFLALDKLNADVLNRAAKQNFDLVKSLADGLLKKA